MGFKTVIHMTEREIVEKKSRFIGRIYPIQAENEVKEILASIKKEHHQANHHCTAFRLHGLQLIERYSDDGEPGGTAGMPMLEVLRGRGLENVLVVSIRYFGGTKLGTGGLVRAYTKSAQSVVDSTDVVEIGRFVKLTIVVDYGLSGKLDYQISLHSYILEGMEYGEKVVYTLYVASDNIAQAQASFTELTNGACVMSTEDPVEGYISKGRFISGDVL